MRHHEYYETYRSFKLKPEWGGITIGDAFKQMLPFSIRRVAQRMFYKNCNTVQLRSKEAMGLQETDITVKPQIAPFYTLYPSVPAAFASIGLTAFLEFKTATSGRLLQNAMAEELEDPAADVRLPVDVEAFNALCHRTAQAVETRLLLQDLENHGGFESVEVYRLFVASQAKTLFQTTDEVVNAVVLYGDLLPDLSTMRLHEITAQMFDELLKASIRYYTQIKSAGAHDLLDIGKNWARELIAVLPPYVPPKPESGDASPGEPIPPGQLLPPGTVQPSAPVTLGKGETIEDWVNKLLPQDKGKGQMGPSANEVLEAIKNAIDQGSAIDDIRSDILGEQLGARPFEDGGISGTITEGHEVRARIGGEEQEGEIFDRPVELAEDPDRVQALVEEAFPITNQMRKMLYPSVHQIPINERVRSSGHLDPKRLPVAEFQGAVYKRVRIKRIPDPRGKPLILVCCDGSGSLNTKQMRGMKIFSTACLESTARSEIEVMMGIYHSGQARVGLAGPLVQWVYHPEKTPGTSRRDGVRALVALEDHGTGSQSDALSLAYMLESARQVARYSNVYQLLVTDCAWNRSFSTERSPADEVCDVISAARESFGDRLHTTVVALGRTGKTGIEAAVDHVIQIPDEDLDNPFEFAEKLGTYVADCLRSRRRI